jgi:LPS-assembly lipoprotein
MSLFRVVRNGRISIALALAAVLLAPACGFRLQGAEGYPASMATTYIETQDRYTIFYRELSASLRIGGVELVDSSVDASAIIRIESDQSGQRVLTVSGRNVPTEYDVYYRVQYSVWMDGQETLPSHSISQNRDYTYDETLVLGKNREEQGIREAIAKDLVRRVSQELSRL